MSTRPALSCYRLGTHSNVKLVMNIKSGHDWSEASPSIQTKYERGPIATTRVTKSTYVKNKDQDMFVYAT